MCIRDSHRTMGARTLVFSRMAVMAMVVGVVVRLMGLTIGVVSHVFWEERLGVWSETAVRLLGLVLLFFLSLILRARFGVVDTVLVVVQGWRRFGLHAIFSHLVVFVLGQTLVLFRLFLGLQFLFGFRVLCFRFTFGLRLVLLRFGFQLLTLGTNLWDLIFDNNVYIQWNPFFLTGQRRSAFAAGLAHGAHPLVFGSNSLGQIQRFDRSRACFFPCLLYTSRCV